MKTIITLLALSLTTTGCILVTEGEPHDTYNYAPTINWADAGCFWDSYYYEDIWYFDADVSDFDGLYDVVSVYADVYDTATGRWIETFELDPTNDPSFWSSTWFADTTYVSCYYGGYEVDITAYDTFNDYDIITIKPYTFYY